MWTVPRVGPREGGAGQPWAGGRNPFGIGIPSLRHYFGFGVEDIAEAIFVAGHAKGQFFVAMAPEFEPSAYRYLGEFYGHNVFGFWELAGSETCAPGLSVG